MPRIYLLWARTMAAIYHGNVVEMKKRFKELK
jgi:hypothetical protein